LRDVVAHCLNDTLEVADDWIVERFGNIFVTKRFDLTDIELPQYKNTKVNKVNYIDESILDEYNYYNDYMWKRNLTKDVVDRF
jgi:hypothetical protein